MTDPLEGKPSFSSIHPERTVDTSTQRAGGGMKEQFLVVLRPTYVYWFKSNVMCPELWNVRPGEPSGGGIV